MSKPTKAALSKDLVPAPHAITLADLDAMPAQPVRHVTLGEMDPQQLGTMLGGLHGARARFESLSGACATLAGLVCIEAKKRLAHGGYLPWLQTHLGKSREMASRYSSVAREFLKCQPKLTFEQLSLALMDQAQEMGGEALDLTHPMVRAVADWTKGRTFYELQQEYCGKGGKTYEREDGKGERKGLTPDEAREFLVTVAQNATRELNVVLHEKPYPALLPADLDGLIANCKAVLEEAEAWRKLTKAEREEALAELLQKHAPPEPAEPDQPQVDAASLPRSKAKATKGAK